MEISDLYLLVDKVVLAGQKAKEAFEQNKASSLELDASLYQQQLLELLDASLGGIAAAAAAAGAGAAGSSSNGILDQLQEAIFRNGQLEVANVHIRYEDTGSNPDVPFAVGLTLNSFCTTGSIGKMAGSATSPSAASDAPASGLISAAVGPRTAGVGPSAHIGPKSSSAASTISSSSPSVAAGSFAAGSNAPADAASAPGADGMMHRRAQVDKLAIYWDPLTPQNNLSNLPDMAKRMYFQSGITSSDHLYVLAPMSPSAYVVWNYRNLPGHPGMKINFSIGQLKTNLTTAQYHGAIFLQSWLSDAKMKEMRKGRPAALPPNADAAARRARVRAMWRYAINLVTAMKQQFAYRPPRWTLSKDVRKGFVKGRKKLMDDYMAAYRKLVDASAVECKKALKSGAGSNPAKPDEKLVNAVKLLEQSLSHDTALLWRTMVRLEYEKTIPQPKSISDDAPAPDKQSGGLVSSLFSYFGGSSSSSSAAKAPATPGKSSSRASGSTPRQPIAVDSDEIEKRMALARASTDSTVFLEATAELRAASFAILRDKHTPIITSTFSGQATYRTTKGRTFTATLTVPDLRVMDAVTKDTRHPLMISKRATPESDNNPGDGSLLHLEIENQPSADVDIRVRIVSQPLIVIFAPECLRALARFSVVPPAAAAVRAAASASLSSLQAQVVADAYSALESRRRLELDAHIAAPVLVLPESIRRTDSRKMVVQLGDVHFRSAKAETEREQRTASSVAADASRINKTISLDRNYDTWTLAVSNVAAYLQHPGSTASAATEDEPVIEPVSVNLCLQTCIQPASVSKNRLRAQGELPRFAVRVSLGLIQQLQALQKQGEELVDGMALDYDEVQKEFRSTMSSAGIQEGDAAGMEVLAEAAGQAAGVEAAAADAEQAAERLTPLADDTALVADFSVGMVALELFDVRSSAMQEIALQRACAGAGSSAAAVAAPHATRPDISVAINGLSLGASYGPSGSTANATLSGIEVIDRYQRSGAAFEHLVSSSVAPQVDGVSVLDSIISSASAQSTGVTSSNRPLISVDVAYKSKQYLKKGEVPLFADVSFSALHVGYNPETIAALQLYAAYLMRYLAVTPSAATAAGAASPSVTTAAVPPPPAPPTSSAAGAGAASALLDSVAAALDGDDDDAPIGDGTLSPTTPALTRSTSTGASASSSASQLHPGTPVLLHVNASLGAVTLSLNKEILRRRVAIIAVGGLKAQYSSTPAGDGVQASLGHLSLVDCSSPGTRYSSLLSGSSTGTGRADDDGDSQPMLSVTFRSYQKSSPLYPGHDSEVALMLRSLKFVHDQQAIMEIVDYALSGLLGTLLTSAGELAGSAIKEAATSKMKLGVVLDGLRLVAPVHVTSQKAVIMDLGTIQVGNSFVLDEGAAAMDTTVDRTLDRMDISLLGIGLSTTTDGGLTSSEIKAKTGDLSLSILRPLDPRFLRQPGLEIGMRYDGAELAIGRDQYALLMEILDSNVGGKDRDVAAATVLYDRDYKFAWAADDNGRIAENSAQDALVQYGSQASPPPATQVSSAPSSASTPTSGPVSTLRFRLAVSGDIAVTLRGNPKRIAGPTAALDLASENPALYDNLLRFGIQRLAVAFDAKPDGSSAVDVSIRQLLAQDVRKCTATKPAIFRTLVASADSIISGELSNAHLIESIYAASEQVRVVVGMSEQKGTEVDLRLSEAVVTLVPEAIERLLYFVSATAKPASGAAAGASMQQPSRPALTDSAVASAAAPVAPAKPAPSKVAVLFRSSDTRFLVPGTASSADLNSADFLLLGFNGEVRYGTDGSSADAMSVAAQLQGLSLQVVPSRAVKTVLIQPEGGVAAAAVTTIIRPVNITASLHQSEATDEHTGASKADRVLKRVVRAQAGALDVAISFAAVNSALSALACIKDAGLLDLEGSGGAAASEPASQLAAPPSAPAPPAAEPTASASVRLLDDLSVSWEGLLVTLLDDAPGAASGIIAHAAAQPDQASKPVVPVLIQARLKGVTLSGQGVAGLYSLNGALTISLDAWDRRTGKLQPLVLKPWVFGIRFIQEQPDLTAEPTTRISVVANSPLLLAMSDRFLQHLSAGAQRWGSTMAETLAAAALTGSDAATPAPAAASTTVVPPNAVSRQLSDRLSLSRVQMIHVAIPLVRLDIGAETDEDLRPLVRMYLVKMTADVDTQALLEPAMAPGIRPAAGTVSSVGLRMSGLHVLDCPNAGSPGFRVLITSAADRISAVALTKDDGAQLTAVQALHGDASSVSGAPGATITRQRSVSDGSGPTALFDLKFTSVSTAQSGGAKIPQHLRGTNPAVHIAPLAASTLNVAFDRLHIGWNAQTLLELAQLAVNMLEPSGPDSARQKAATAAAEAASAKAAPTATVVDPPSARAATSAAGLALDMSISAQSLSLAMHKERLKRKVVYLCASGFAMRLKSYDESAQDRQDTSTEISGSLADIQLIDLTASTAMLDVGDPAGSRPILSKAPVAHDSASAATASSPQQSTALIEFGVQSFGPGAVKAAGSIVSATVRPVQVVFLNTVVQEALDFLSIGILNLTSLFSSPPPQYVDIEPASSLESRKRWTKLAVTVEAPRVLVPASAGAAGGLELSLASVVIDSVLQDRLVTSPSTADSSRDSPNVAHKSVIGREAAADTLGIKLNGLTVALRQSFSISASTTVASPNRDVLLSASDLGVSLASFQSALAARLGGMGIGVQLPPLQLTLSDAQFAGIMAVLDGNLAAKPPTMATEQARCLISRPSIDTPPGAVLKQKADRCDVCFRSFGGMRSRNFCEGCGGTVCLACVAGDAWDEEADRSKAICRTCLSTFAAEARAISDDQTDLDASTILGDATDAEGDASGSDAASGGAGIRRMNSMGGAGSIGRDTPGGHGRAGSSVSGAQTNAGGADSVVTFNYGTLSTDIGNPMIVEVSLPLVSLYLLKASTAPSTPAPAAASGITTTAALASLHLVGTHVTYTSVPEASQAETQVGIAALRVLDDRPSASKAATRAILVPNFAVLNPRSASFGTQAEQDASRLQQVSLVLTSSGGASTMNVAVSGCDIHPNIPAIMEVAQFFTSNSAAGSDANDENHGPDASPTANPSGSSGASAAAAKASASAAATTSSAVSTKRGKVNIVIPSPGSEMTIAVALTSTRVVIMQDVTWQRSPALILSLAAIVRGSMATARVKLRNFAGISRDWLAHQGIEVPLHSAPHSASTSQMQSYNSGLFARGKLQDKRMEFGVQLLEASLARTRMAMTPEAAALEAGHVSSFLKRVLTMTSLSTAAAPATASIVSAASEFVSGWETDSSKATLGNLDGPRVSVISPFTVSASFKSLSSTLTQLDLATLTDAARGYASSSSSAAAAAVLPPIGNAKASKRRIDTTRCVAIRGVPADRMIIDVQSESRIGAALALSDIDLITAIANGWIAVISGGGNASSSASTPAAPAPSAAPATPASSSPFDLPSEWHAFDYEVVFPGGNLKLGMGMDQKLFQVDSSRDADLASAGGSSVSSSAASNVNDNKLLITLVDIEGVSQRDRDDASKGEFDAGDGRFTSHGSSPTEIATVIRPLDALVAVNNVTVGSMSKDEIRKLLVACKDGPRVLRFRALPAVYSVRLHEGLGASLVSGVQGRDNEVVRLLVDSVNLEVYGDILDVNKYVEADLAPARAAIAAEEAAAAADGHGRCDSLASAPVLVGGRLSDVVVRPRSTDQVRRRRSLVVSQAKHRPLRQCVFGSLSLSIAADAHNPRNGSWEALIEPWRVRVQAAMFDGQYTGGSSAAAAAVSRPGHSSAASASTTSKSSSLPPPVRLLSVSADELQVSLSEDLYQSLLAALAKGAVRGEGNDSSRLLADVRDGDVLQTDLPPNSFPYIIRNETGLRVALTYTPAAGRREGVMWSRPQDLAASGPSESGGSATASVAGSATGSKAPPAADSFAASAVRRGAVVVPPHAEVGLAIGGSLPAMSTTTASSASAASAGSGVHLIAVQVEGGADVVRDVNVDAVGTTTKLVQLWEATTGLPVPVEMCLQTLVADGRKLVTLRSSTHVHNYCGIDLEVFASLGGKMVNIGTVAGRNSLAVPMDKLAAGALFVRPALLGFPDNPYHLSQPINITREVIGEVLCKSAPAGGTTAAKSTDRLPKRRFATRTFYRHGRRYLCLAIHAPLCVTNSLPMRLEYEVRSGQVGSGGGFVAPGENCDLFEASGGQATCGPGEGPAEPEIRMRVDGYDWSAWIAAGTGEFASSRKEAFIAAAGGRGASTRAVRLCLDSNVRFPGTTSSTEKRGDFANNTGRVEMNIFAPHWILNLTGLPIIFGERAGEGGNEVIASGMQARGVQVTDECYENERYYLAKWGSPMPTERPHWSNEAGTKSLTREDIDSSMAANPSWRWVGAWTAGPWDYESVGFDRFLHADHGGRHHFNPEYRGGDIVRRRKWYRVREQVPAGRSDTGSKAVAGAATASALVNSALSRLGVPHGYQPVGPAGGGKLPQLSTGTPLGASQSVPADSIVVFSPSEGLLFMRIGSGKWTPGRPVDGTEGVEGFHVEGPRERGYAPNGAEVEVCSGYDLIMIRERAPAPFQATRCISILPAYMVVNATPSSLFFRQAGGGPMLLAASEPGAQPEVELPPLSYAPVWWTDGRWDAPKGIQFSPACAKGGWSPPISPFRPQGRPSVEIPVSITVPSQVPYVRTSVGVAALGSVVIGVSVRPCSGVPKSNTVIVTQQTHPAAPLRPPVYLLGSSAPAEEVNAVAMAYGLDMDEQERWKKRSTAALAGGTSSSSAISGPAGGNNNATSALNISEEARMSVELTRPYIAFVNHSRCMLAFRQHNVRAYHCFGAAMSRETAERESMALNRLVESNKGVITSRSLGIAYARSRGFVPANSVVPVGLTDPLSALESGKVLLQIRAMDMSTEQASSSSASGYSSSGRPPVAASGRSGFGPAALIDVSQIEQPIVLAASPDGRTCVVLEVRLHGNTRKIVVYDRDSPTAAPVPAPRATPKRGSADSWDTMEATRGAHTGSSESDDAGGFGQDAGTLADALDFGTGDDAISAALSQMRPGGGTSAASHRTETYKVRTWRESYSVAIAGLGISLVMNEVEGPSELAYASLSGLAARYKGTPSQNAWAICAGRLQIDDQDPDAYYPAVLSQPRAGLNSRDTPPPFLSAVLRTVPRPDRDIIGGLAGDLASYIDGLHANVASADISPLRLRLSYEFLSRIAHALRNLKKAHEEVSKEIVSGGGAHAADIDMPPSIVSAQPDNGADAGRAAVASLLNYRAAKGLDGKNEAEAPVESTAAKPTSADAEGMASGASTPMITGSDPTSRVLARLLDGHKSDPMEALAFVDTGGISRLSIHVDFKRAGSGSGGTRTYNEDIQTLLAAAIPGEGLIASAVKQAVYAVLRSGVGLVDAPIAIDPVTINADFSSISKCSTALIETATANVSKAIPAILGSTSLLGNASNIVRGVGEGVSGAAKAAESGDVFGMLSSGAGIVTNTIGGVAGTASDLVSTIGGIGAQFQGEAGVRREAARERSANKPKNLVEGAAMGAFAFGSSLFRGVTGLVEKPMEGVAKEGAAGFMTGIARGVVGLAAAPVVAAAAGVSTVLQGVQNTLQSDEVKANRDAVVEERIRPPRVFYGQSCVMRPYSQEDAQLVADLRHMRDTNVRGAVSSGRLVCAADLGDGGKLLILSRHVLHLEASTGASPGMASDVMNFEQSLSTNGSVSSAAELASSSRWTARLLRPLSDIGAIETTTKMHSASGLELEVIVLHTRVEKARFQPLKFVLAPGLPGVADQLRRALDEAKVAAQSTADIAPISP